MQILTVGQYLRPTERHLPVVRYWAPEEFKALELAAYDARLRARRRRPAGALVATTPTSTSSRTGRASARSPSVRDRHLVQPARRVRVQALAQRELQRELLTAH